MVNIVELFSGIGSQVKALKNMGAEINTLGISEWDVHAILAYDLIHNENSEIPENILTVSKDEVLSELNNFTFSNTGKAPLEFSSLKTYSLECLQRLFYAVKRNNNFVDISGINGKDFPDAIDILTYSFPCQDLSNVGAFHGYTKGIDKDSGSRSSLLWQVGRILSEMRDCGKNLPKYLLMENVPALLSDRHYPNFSVWINDLRKLGYVSKYYLLNALDFGLPQNRPRLLMISVFCGNDDAETGLVLEYFKYKSQPENIVQDYVSSKYYKKYTVKELLRTDYSDEKQFNEAVEATPNKTVSRQRIWDENPQIVLKGYKYNKDIDFIRTITTKQDRNPNSGNLYFDSGIKGRSLFRYLTPRECMLFMGFNDHDYDVLKDNNIEFHKGDELFSRDKIIKLAGNSIPVKMLEGIFLQITQIEQLLNDYRRHSEERNPFNENANDKNIRVVRSFLFASGIRSRLKDEVYPENADLLYPKYKTAIFIKSDFWDGKKQNGILALPEHNTEFWKKLIEKSITNNMYDYKTAIDMGWNAIVIWNKELQENEQIETLNWLLEMIKKNLSGDYSGKILFRKYAV